ncbi:MAG: PIG-L deacetylase family protein [Nanoarchaeota archaeon]
MKNQETILVLCAHNDDGVIGAGGTLAKYAQEGKRVLTVIFSYGELSSPQLKPQVVKERRMREAIEADKIIGGLGITYLGLREGHFEEDAAERNIVAKLKYIIGKYKPNKVFTHSVDDPHPDHRACFHLSWRILKNYPKVEIYSFDIWNVLAIKNRNKPRMISDISKFFRLKMTAFRAHQSQLRTPAVFLLFIKTFIKDSINGIRYAKRFVEVFVRIQ